VPAVLIAGRHKTLLTKFSQFKKLIWQGMLDMSYTFWCPELYLLTLKFCRVTGMFTEGSHHTTAILLHRFTSVS